MGASSVNVLWIKADSEVLTKESTVKESSRPLRENVGEVLRYQLSRRAFLGTAAAGVAAGTLLSACTNNPTPDEDGTPTAAGIEIGKANIPTDRAKTVVIEQADFTVFENWNNLVPNGAPGASGFDTICRESMLYLNLVTGEVIPWLCTDYSYNEAKDQLTFTFDPKAAWSDGSPLTSADFKFTVEMLRDRSDLLGGGGDYSDFVQVVETPDEQTAVVKLTRPNARFHYNFIAAVASFDIKPQHIWQDQDPARFVVDTPVRTGPYVLDQVLAVQKMFVWKKNPAYWNIDNLDPKPEYVIYQSAVAQADAAALAFERAEVDVSRTDAAHVALLVAQGYPALLATQFNDPCPRTLWVNCDPSRGIIGEPKMHWVISSLIDREKVATSIWPVPTDIAQYPWANYDGNKKWEDPDLLAQYPMTYDPARAKELLDEIAPVGDDGARTYNGNPIDLELITCMAIESPEFIMLDMVRAELEELGVQATAKQLSGSVYDDKEQKGEFDVASKWTCDVIWDPQQLYRNLESEQAQPIGTNALGKNPVRLKDDELTALSQELSGLDPESDEAKGLFERALVRYFERLPYIATVQTGYPQYFNTAFWTGWPSDDDLYEVPLNWWAQWLFVIASLEATGQVAP